jgi:hypothetical protein
MAKKTIRIVAIQPRRAGRLASNGAQGSHPPIIQSFAVIMLTLSVIFKIRTSPEDMETVAEFAALQADEVLLGIAKRRIHALTPSILQHPGHNAPSGYGRALLGS